MKPIICFFLKNIHSLAARAEIKERLPKELKDDYHVLILESDKNDIKVFFEKDMDVLDKEKLEQLLGTPTE